MDRRLEGIELAMKGFGARIDAVMAAVSELAAQLKKVEEPEESEETDDEEGEEGEAKGVAETLREEENGGDAMEE